MDQPLPLPAALDASARLGRMRQRLERQGLWLPQQAAGRRWAIGCVSLEITQRCNLDCTLCYLSDDAESVRDPPLAEVLRRVDLIAAHYGPNTDVQISGGEPTLRRRDELLAIVHHARACGLRASLFTNGIRATRELLAMLAEVGLSDVAFHVDMTQQRAGYDSEEALNALRLRYIEAARGLPLAVFFNTSVFEGNLHELPLLARFFARHSDVVSLASFQLQADTGRGVLRERAASVTQASVMAALRSGAGCELSFDTLIGGHPSCNRYAFAWVINGRMYDLGGDARDQALVARVMRETAQVSVPRTNRAAAARAMAAALLARPALWPGLARYGARLLWRAWRDLWAARGRIGKVSFFLHNFMDACQLDPQRIDACVFAVMTADGPMSMCAFNAERDGHLTRPLRLTDGSVWQPLRQIPVKRLKGRGRHAAVAARSLHAT